MSNFLINIGCFKCGEESVKDFDITFNKISCQLCGMENNATELLIDKMFHLESKLKAQQEVIDRLQKEKAELVELLKIIKIVHYDNLPMYHSEWSLLDSDIKKKIMKILGMDKSLQTSEDHVQ